MTIVIAGLLIGCAAPIPGYQQLAGEEVPATWSPGHTWRFDIKGRAGSGDGQLTIRLTDQKASTCSYADWLQASVVSTTVENPPLVTWYAESRGDSPAYLVSGRNLVVLLNPWICDNDIVLRGVLDVASASGTLIEEGMLSGLAPGDGVLGTFDARVVR